MFDNFFSSEENSLIIFFEKEIFHILSRSSFLHLFSKNSVLVEENFFISSPSPSFPKDALSLLLKEISSFLLSLFSRL